MPDIRTVGELRQFIVNLPDEMKIVRVVEDSYHTYIKQGRYINFITGVYDYTDLVYPGRYDLSAGEKAVLI